MKCQNFGIDSWLNFINLKPHPKFWNVEMCFFFHFRPIFEKPFVRLWRVCQATVFEQILSPIASNRNRIECLIREKMLMKILVNACSKVFYSWVFLERVKEESSCVRNPRASTRKKKLRAKRKIPEPNIESIPMESIASLLFGRLCHG